MQPLPFSWPLRRRGHGTSFIPGLHSTSRPHAVSDHSDQFAIATQLRSRFYEIEARFLLTELKTGLALLDVADTSQNGAFNERRRALAREAYDVVADRLARIVLAAPIAERDEIRRLHQQLGDRLGR